MKAYIKVIAVFMAFLILVGSVLGWNLSSFSSATSAASSFMSYVNAIGTNALSVAGDLLSLPAYWFGKIPIYDEELPYCYKHWSQSSPVRDYAEFMLYYSMAYEKVYGTDEGMNLDPTFSVKTVTELYHYDMYRVIAFDDTVSFARCKSGIGIMIVHWFSWWFDREAIKEEYQTALAKCSMSHDFPLDNTVQGFVDIFLKYEFNYEGE